MKLLVTTDFSTNSKGAIRFVQMLAQNTSDLELTFYHAISFVKPTVWHDTFYNSYKEEEKDRLLNELKKFVMDIIGPDEERFASIDFVVESAISPENDTIKYAEKKKIDMICIATQGAGMLRKILGTFSEQIVKNAKIPVLVVPSHYKSKTLKKITYLTDFENVKKEMKKVAKLSDKLFCDLEVVHFDSSISYLKNFAKDKALFETGEYKDAKLLHLESNLELSLVERISQYIEKKKPSLFIMFTKKEKSIFERIFLPSKSIELTYSTKVPILIYPK